ncbi:MAG: MOSC N-terminal beta barrel domain-containing protein [Cyanobacteria bacterium J06621_12]
MPMTSPHVSRLLIYPIKSLDWVDCDRVTILDSGALEGDRTWGIFDQEGKFVNGKGQVKIHALRSEFDLAQNTINLRIQGTEETAKFDLTKQQDALCSWLESYFGFPVQLKQNLNMGFPDDTVSPGATIVSTATLEAIASWYPELTTEDIRRRFRANIELGGVPAFWEDRLFTTADQTVKFMIGEVEFQGVNPCQRCIVVTRDPQTGKPYPQFQKTFITQRKNTLPETVERSRFNHYFRLAINTRLNPSEAGKVVKLRDLVEM